MSLEVGQNIKESTTEPVTREQLKAYAQASGDNNPIHIDEDVARKMGFPSVIVHGMISMAYLADHLALCFPETTHKLQSFSTRFRKVAYPGDRITCGGQVKEVTPDGALKLSLWGKNDKGELIVDGEAVIKSLVKSAK